MVFLSPCSPDPAGTGWEQRAHALLRAYARHLDVELWFQPSADRGDIRPVLSQAGCCVEIRPFYLALLERDGHGLTSALRTSLAGASLVHLFRLPMLAGAIDHPVLIWDLDELERSLQDPCRQLAGEVLEPAGRQQRRQAFSALAARSRMLLVSSPCEREDWLRPVPEVIPNSVELQPDGEGLPQWTEADRTVLFVGNFNHPPNVLAVRLLIERIWPELAARRPDLRLRLVGRGPRDRALLSWLERCCRLLPLELILDPLDIRPCYRGCRLSLSPILTGGGTRLKILEAFALGCPVVATPKGAEGLAVVDGRHLRLADGVSPFVEACLQLLEDATAARQLAAEARRLVRRDHGQAAVDQGIARLLQRLGLELPSP